MTCPRLILSRAVARGPRGTRSLRVRRQHNAEAARENLKTGMHANTDQSHRTAQERLAQSQKEDGGLHEHPETRISRAFVRRIIVPAPLILTYGPSCIRGG